MAHKCASQAAFATLYLDSTDTFFIGQGPDKATNGKTKEGRIERKVGVVLLCNERGEPLRWKVVEGRSADNILFRDVFDELKAVDWACDVPIVVDRAMGSTADIRAMFETGLKFVTALRATEFRFLHRSNPAYRDRSARTHAQPTTRRQQGRPDRIGQDRHPLMGLSILTTTCSFSISASVRRRTSNRTCSILAAMC